ncbi:TonB-dependent receptor plug domain-containing protein, partial [Pelomicrobium sp. G1]|uniref:TonB-dependent receptor plug domain-containing protein n=1 Tax=Pelomicrobium sp. G1 TaxID=3452920 RepID=UPI003F772241
AENPAATLEAPTVEVVGTTPLPSGGAPLEQVPAAVQAATGEQIRRQQALDLSDFMERNLAGVTVNAAQANPFQPDL